MKHLFPVKIFSKNLAKYEIFRDFDVMADKIKGIRVYSLNIAQNTIDHAKDISIEKTF